MKNPLLIVTAAVMCYAASFFTAAQAADAPVVTLAQGQVVGKAKDASHLYFGIPYAASPVGDLRWKAPQPAQSWNGIKQAKEYGEKCPQAGIFGANGNEDCLFINITTPAKRSSAKLPVAVWVHGGSFKSGSGEYGGETFTRDGVIFVSMNYRLGPLGGFAHPALQAEIVPGQPHTNYGLLDQIAALAWVRANIAAFGGDPNRVTVFGESAGGTSTAYLVASPLSRGLFQRAIVHSGAAGMVPSEAAYTQRGAVPALVNRGEALAKAAGLSNPTAAQLRAASVSSLVKANNNFHMGGPVVDGVSLPDGVREIFASGRQQPVALIAGSNSYEATLAAIFPLAPKADAFLKANIQTIAPLYGLPANAADESLRRLFYNDVYFAVQMRALAKNMSQAGASGYFYHFAYDLEECRTRPNYFGVGHAAELLYTFDVISVLPRLPKPLATLACSVPGGPATPTANDKKMSATKHALWVNFMKSGTPGSGWQAMTPSSHPVMHFSNSGANVEQDLHKQRLDYIEAHYDEMI